MVVVPVEGFVEPAMRWTTRGVPPVGVSMPATRQKRSLSLGKNPTCCRGNHQTSPTVISRWVASCSRLSASSDRSTYRAAASRSHMSCAPRAVSTTIRRERAGGLLEPGSPAEVSCHRRPPWPSLPMDGDASLSEALGGWCHEHVHQSAAHHPRVACDEDRLR